MSEMWQGLFWGALFSIPIGILINLASPLIAKRIDRQTKEAGKKRAERDIAFKIKAQALSRDRSALYVELLEVLLRVAFFSALFGVLSGAMFFVGQVSSFFSTIAFALGQLLALIGTLIVLNIVRPAIVLVREVRSLQESQ